MMRIDGRWASEISARDRALHYGDGVFRTLRVQQGVVRDLECHLARLAHDAGRLGLAMPAAESWRDDIAALVAAHGDGIIKCLLTAGDSLRGYKRAEPQVSRRLVMWSPATAWPAEYAEQGIRLHLCETRLALQPRLAGVKHLNRLENVLARAEWCDPDIPEGLLLDMAGYVAEGVMSNLFWWQGGAWHTPALTACGVHGVLRQRVLEHLAACGSAVRLVQASLAEVLAAEEVFVGNSVIGLWPVRELAGHHWREFPRIRALRASLEEPG